MEKLVSLLSFFILFSALILFPQDGDAGTMAAEFNVQMAGSLILALPVLVLYIFMGKYLISGQMSGAVTAS